MSDRTCQVKSPLLIIKNQIQRVKQQNLFIQIFFFFQLLVLKIILKLFKIFYNDIYCFNSNSAFILRCKRYYKIKFNFFLFKFCLNYIFNLLDLFSGINYSASTTARNTHLIFHPNYVREYVHSTINPALPPEPDKPVGIYIYGFCLILIPTATILGNLLVIVSVLRFKILHSAINFLILGLAVADLFVALFVMPYAVYIYVSLFN